MAAGSFKEGTIVDIPEASANPEPIILSGNRGDLY